MIVDLLRDLDSRFSDFIQSAQENGATDDDTNEVIAARYGTDLPDPPDEELDLEARIQSDFDAWYHWILSLHLAYPSEIVPEIAQLCLPTENYKANELTFNEYAYTDKSGTTFPIDNIREIIPAANRFLGKCNDSRPFKTYITTRVMSSFGLSAPSGVHIFDPPRDLSASLCRDALDEIQSLFNQELTRRNPLFLMYDPPSKACNVLLFYNPKAIQHQPTFKEVIERLHSRAPRLTEYILLYCNVFVRLLCIDTDRLERAQLSLVYYPKNAGLNPHIDSIFQFNGTIGPIFTIAMGTGRKMFDMLPTLEHIGTPTRIYSRPNQFTVMDGMSRVSWSHCLPWGNTMEQWTVALKFPGMTEARRVEQFVFNGVTTPVPSYLD